MEKAHDTIYITNLPDSVTEEKLAEVFGSIGIIKHDRKNDKPKSKEAVAIRISVQKTHIFNNLSYLHSLDLYRQGYRQTKGRWYVKLINADAQNF
jgi:RNA recognition motif-containing protein